MTDVKCLRLMSTESVTDFTALAAAVAGFAGGHVATPDEVSDHITSNLRSRNNSAEFTIQADQIDGVYFVSGIIPAVKSDTAKGCSGIADQGYIETEIRSHACCRRHTVIGGKPDYNECRDPGTAQVLLKPGADKGTVYRLVEYHFVVDRFYLVFESVAWHINAAPPECL